MPVKYLKETPSQTAGPYVHIGTYPATAGLDIRTQEKPYVLGGAAPHRIRLEGTVVDGAGSLLRDAIIEIWQADAEGHYNAEGFSSFGRSHTDFKTGLWWFETVKPGRTPYRDGKPQAPHVTLLIFARGINFHLHTRVYFDDEADANAVDPVLAQVAPERRGTLLAKRVADAKEPTYRIEIFLQGDRETVFFDF